MEIKASDVKRLRKKTAAGMMDCKKALVQAKGDFANAEKILKELGLAVAAKRAGRSTEQGRVFSKISSNKAALLELSCETDFVAKNKDFIDLGNRLLDTIIEKNLTEKNSQLEIMVKDVIGIIKENIALKRFNVLSAGPDEILKGYIHGEGRIGVIVKAKADNNGLLNNKQVNDTVFDIALHIAAFAPLFIASENIDQEYIKEQEALFLKQAEKTGKPEKIIQGIAKGKLKKHLSEICLLDQGFVKNEKIKVNQMLANVSKEVGGTIKITGFLYFRIGDEM